MRTSAPGSRASLPVFARRTARGFTLVELLVVIALIAVATGVASLALRDPASTALEREAARLAALLEAARAEARATGVAAWWEPRTLDNGQAVFQFVGLPAEMDLPAGWLEAGTSAEVVGTRRVVLGPEPLIGAQRILLRLGDRRLVLATDGIGPFAVVADVAPAAN